MREKTSERGGSEIRLGSGGKPHGHGGTVLARFTAGRERRAWLPHTSRAFFVLRPWGSNSWPLRLSAEPWGQCHPFPPNPEGTTVASMLLEVAKRLHEDKLPHTDETPRWIEQRSRLNSPAAEVVNTVVPTVVPPGIPNDTPRSPDRPSTGSGSDVDGVVSDVTLGKLPSHMGRSKPQALHVTSGRLDSSIQCGTLKLSETCVGSSGRWSWASKVSPVLYVDHWWTSKSRQTPNSVLYRSKDV